MKSTRKVVLLIMTMVMIVTCSVTAQAATVRGKYPTRKGTILVTSDFYLGLIPTGHAAIVYNRNYVVEAVAKGVILGRNNWMNTRREVYGLTVKKTSSGQDAYAADWAYRQRGKKYNFNYFNTSTRNKFYCSQLVWAAFYDNFRINLDTWRFGKAVHPMELVYSGYTSTIFYYHR